MAYWNLFCLGQALLPLIENQEDALAALESYKTVFPAALQARMRAKLGLPDEHEGDGQLIEATFRLLASNKVDYTIFWRRLCGFTAQSGHEPVRDLFFDLRILQCLGATVFRAAYARGHCAKGRFDA